GLNPTTGCQFGVAEGDAAQLCRFSKEPKPDRALPGSFDFLVRDPQTRRMCFHVRQHVYGEQEGGGDGIARLSGAKLNLASMPTGHRGAEPPQPDHGAAVAATRDRRGQRKLIGHYRPDHFWLKPFSTVK